MIYKSGLDWSGDPSDPRAKGSIPYLSFALVDIREDDMAAADGALLSVRRLRKLGDGHPFKYSDSRPQVRAAFFAGIRGLAFVAHVYVPDKWQWPRSYMVSTDGPDRINGGIDRVVCASVTTLPGGRDLIIDGSKSEARVLRATRKVLRRAMDALEAPSLLRKVRFAPDDGADGTILQIADMIAGAARDGSVGQSYLNLLGSRVIVV